jgi:hypothetical protein
MAAEYRTRLSQKNPSAGNCELFHQRAVPSERHLPSLQTVANSSSDLLSAHLTPARRKGAGIEHLDDGSRWIL